MGFLILVSLACVLCYTVRLLAEFLKNKFSPRASFIAQPKPMEVDALDAYLSSFRFADFEKQTRKHVIDNMSESNRRVCDEFVRCMEVAGINQMFEKTLTVKDRIFIPGASLAAPGGLD